MRNAKQDFTPIERLMVLMILLVLAAVAVQNLANSLKDSEEHTVKAATLEYVGVKDMYAARNRVGPPIDAGSGSVDVTVASNASIH